MSEPLLDQMRSLLDDPQTRVPPARIEQLIVDGCARKLNIEAERLRLERSLRQAAADAAATPIELPRIARLLAAAEADLSVLAELIRRLRLRHRRLQAL